MDQNTLLDKIDYLSLSLDSFSRKTNLLEERLEELIKRIDSQDKTILELKSIVQLNNNSSANNNNSISTKNDTLSHSNSNNNFSTATSTATSTTTTITKTDTTTSNTVNNLNSNNTTPNVTTTTPTITTPTLTTTTVTTNIATRSNSGTVGNSGELSPNIPTPPPMPPVSPVIQAVATPSTGTGKSPGLSGWNRAKVGIGLTRAFSTNNFFQKTDAEGNVSPIVGGLIKEDLIYIPPSSPKPQIQINNSINISGGDITSPDSSTGISNGNNNSSNSIDKLNDRKSNELPSLPTGSQWAIVWEYNASDDEWVRGIIAVEIESRPFAKGALRNAYKLWIRTNPVDQYSQFTHEEHKKYEEGKNVNTTGKLPSIYSSESQQYVAKDSLLKSQGTFDRFFDDVKMQMICKEFGIRYNSNSPPKPIEFLSAWVLEIQTPDGPVLYGLELFMKGEFKKQNSNFGSIFSDRNTPQAFSHFTYECSAHDLLIVDIQGVDDIYTDPQIHTKDGKGFGMGNLGSKGIDKFINSHKCNPICIQYGLPPIGVNLIDSKQASRVIRGTMLLPDLIPDLDEVTPPTLPLPSDVAHSILQPSQNQSTLTGHDERICVLLCRNDRLISSDSNGHVKIWDLQKLTLIESIRAHRRSVDAIAISKKYMFTASSDKTIKVWELLSDFDTPLTDQKVMIVGSNDAKYILSDHTGEVNGLCLYEKKNLLYSCSFDKSIRVWDLNTMKCIKTLNAHSKSVKSMFLSGKYLFSSSNDASIKIWDLEMHMCIYGMSDAHEAWITKISIHNGRLFSGSRDGEIKEWNLSTFLSTAKFDQNRESITDFLVVQGGYLFVSSDDSTIKIIDLSTMKIIYSIKGHRSGIGALATDSKRIFSGGNDNAIKIWNWVNDTNK